VQASRTRCEDGVQDAPLPEDASSPRVLRDVPGSVDRFPLPADTKLRAQLARKLDARISTTARIGVSGPPGTGKGH